MPAAGARAMPLVAPVTGTTGGMVGAKRAEIKPGIRQVTLCKDARDKFGLRVQAVDNVCHSHSLGPHLALGPLPSLGPYYSPPQLAPYCPHAIMSHFSHNFLHRPFFACVWTICSLQSDTVIITEFL